MPRSASLSPALLAAAATVSFLHVPSSASSSLLDTSSLSILSFGAIPSDPSMAASVANGKALYSAMLAANSGLNNTRTVLVPGGLNFTILPYAPASNLHNVTILLEGVLTANTANFTTWPNNTAPGYYIDSTALDVIFIGNSSGITITSPSYTGMIDGNGYLWWWYCLVGGYDNRPNLIGMQHVSDVVIRGIRMINSPSYHLAIVDGLHVDIQDSVVWVDVDGQRDMLSRAGKLTTGTPGTKVGSDVDGSDADASLLPAGIPTFPLNTDGMDLWARDVYIRNVTIQNFDDTVCVKPLNAASGVVAGPCTQDWLVEDVNISFGVGLTIGSVPPDPNVACIRNITFRNAVMQTPIKGIYVKPNPGDVGSGIIDAVTYENITMDAPLWWGIWVGLQQQDQPGGGANTGCSFFYPLPNTTCPTQPRVPVTNLILRNVHSTGALLSPGILRCADVSGTNYTPCTGWVFDNVTFASATNWPVGPGFLCENVVAATWGNGTSPVPNCTAVPQV